MVRSSGRSPSSSEPRALSPDRTALVLASLSDVHTGWAWFVIVGDGLAGVWSLTAHWSRGIRTRALWFFTVVAEVAVFVQAGLGVWMAARQDRQVDRFHMFYGFLAIIAVGILYSYRHQVRHRLHLLYGFGGLFVMGLAIRALLLV